LTSNIGDYIKDGENGFIVSKSNSLEKVLEKITLIDKNDVMKMKRMCRESSRFDYRNYKKELGKIFYNE
jgi:bisphosphoglycerate-dependent phosphoglycerate mutase